MTIAVYSPFPRLFYTSAYSEKYLRRSSLNNHFLPPNSEVVCTLGCVFVDYAPVCVSRRQSRYLAICPTAPTDQPYSFSPSDPSHPFNILTRSPAVCSRGHVFRSYSRPASSHGTRPPAVLLHSYANASYAIRYLTPPCARRRGPVPLNEPPSGFTPPSPWPLRPPLRPRPRR